MRVTGIRGVEEGGETKNGLSLLSLHLSCFKSAQLSGRLRAFGYRQLGWPCCLEPLSAGTSY